MLLHKISKKYKLNEDFLKRIIVEEHLLWKLTPKSKLKKISVNLEDKSNKFIAKLAKDLKVSEDAIITISIENYLENHK